MRQYILFLGLLGLASAGLAPGKQSVHERMTDEEVMHVFRTEPNAIPEYEVIPVHWPKQHKRSDNPLVGLSVDALNNKVSLLLHPTENILIDKDTPVYFASSKNIVKKTMKDVMSTGGKLMEDRMEEASFIVKESPSGTKTISGTVGSKRWVVSPLPNHINYDYVQRYRRSVDNVEGLQNMTAEYHDPHYHVVYKQPAENQGKAEYRTAPPNMFMDLFNKFRFGLFPPKFGINLPTSNDPNNPIAPRVPTRSIAPSAPSGTSNSSVIYPQVLVFADYETVMRHGKDVNKLLEYMLIFWNSVDMKYRSLDNPKVRLNIAGIVIATDLWAFNFISNNIHGKTMHIGAALSDFATRYLPSMEQTFSMDSYDVAVAMNPRTMCYNEACGATIGLAYLSKACDSYYKGAVVQDKGVYDGVETAAHELGHLFGSNHDTDICQSADGYIMAPSNMETENGAFWSSCSVNAFKKFFSKEDSSCLSNKPNTVHPYKISKMPGTGITFDQQCKMKHKANYDEDGSFKSMEVCFRISCRGPKQKGKYWSYPLFPLEGSPCGPNKICAYGKCVSES